MRLDEEEVLDEGWFLPGLQLNERGGSIFELLTNYYNTAFANAINHQMRDTDRCRSFGVCQALFGAQLT